jgi:hypothetical protein
MTMNASMVLMSRSIFNNCKGISEHHKKVREIKQQLRQDGIMTNRMSLT